MWMDLLPKLRAVADVWVAVGRRTDEAVSLKTLGVRAVANSKLFERPGMSVATFEAVSLWLADPVNWPAGVIPREGAAALEALGFSRPVRQAAAA
jgi:hypothetical protein